MDTKHTRTQKISGSLVLKSGAVIKNAAGTTILDENGIGTIDAMVYKGVIDCSGNPNYPAASAGDLYLVSVAGKIGGASGTVVEAGDMLVCKTDGTLAGTQAAVGSEWNIIQTNITAAGLATVVLATAITGFVSGAGTVAAADTLLQAINKLDGNVALRVLLAGDNTITGNQTFTGSVNIGGYVRTVGGTNVIDIDDGGTQTLVSVLKNFRAPSIRATAVAFAGLPASAVEGMLVPVTDSSTATWGDTITGGGANHVLAFYNGTNWTVAGK